MAGLASVPVPFLMAKSIRCALPIVTGMSGRPLKVVLATAGGCGFSRRSCLRRKCGLDVNHDMLDGQR